MGLANYAEDHGDKFRQVLAGIEDSNDSSSASTRRNISKAFADFGGAC